MKAALLYLTLCGLTWAQSELQPHYRKAKQKCRGDHQIMLKGRHSKHGFYIFNYVYSSAVTNNQTQIQKEEEENRNNISIITHGSDRKNVPRKATDNFTDTTQEAREEQKHLDATGNGSKTEGRRTTGSSQNLYRHYGNTTNQDLHQHHLEVIVNKEGNEIATGDNTIEIDGSGDIGFPGQVDTQHGVIIGNEYHDRVKDHQDTRGTDKLRGKDKDGKSGLSSNTKSSKDPHIKIEMKENDASAVWENNPFHDIPKKIKDPSSKDYSKVHLKVITDATNREPGKEEGGHVHLLDKSRRDNSTTKLYTSLEVKANISRERVGEIEPMRTRGSYTNIVDTSEIKVAKENGTGNATVHTKGKDGYTVTVRKLNGQKDGYGVTKPRKKGDVKDGVTSGNHVEIVGVTNLQKKDETRKDVTNGRSKSHLEAAGVTNLQEKDETRKDVTNGRSNSHLEAAGVTNLRKKDGTREDVSNEKSNSHLDAAGITKLQKKVGGEIGTKERLISHVGELGDTKTEKTKQSKVILSRKLNGHMDGSGTTKSHSKGELTLLSGKQISDSGATQHGRKSPGEVGIIHKRPSIGEGGSYEKTNKNANESTLGDPKMTESGKTGFGVTFQKVNKDTPERAISYKKATGDSADLKTSDIDSSNKQEELSGQKSIQFKSALAESRGSHGGIRDILNIPKNEKLKSQGPSLATVKSNRKVMKPSKKASRVNTGTHGSSAAKHYHGYLGVLRRKSSQRGKKRPSVHRNDSSQSSESEENSRQSYEDYQNDRPDSHQSPESTEEARSDESHDHSQGTNSQEDSQERKSTD
ncbi:matrix extracellular phosphoglycoprotein [Podarcis raffonei]|uniref:matrix extracellular phosphoglycoprotein n=1 Tax=Podarcis raffonei TaxID=65483 RepID=UPI0023298D4D|nr:matrix extracellular phosphoglycoprotein [Podarcis raffonei]